MYYAEIVASLLASVNPEEGWIRGLDLISFRLGSFLPKLVKPRFKRVKTCVSEIGFASFG